MKRKEIIVSSEVFDKGLDALEKAQESCRRVGYEMELEVAGTIFQVGYVHKEKAIILHRCGLTIFRNITWMQFIALRARRPFVKVLSCFTYY